jgi:antitoxin MazE
MEPLHMKTRIISVGNSQGIRIPKPLLEETGLIDEVDIRAEGSALIIRAAKQPREGWDSAFAEFAKAVPDTEFNDIPVSLSQWDDEEWEW